MIRVKLDENTPLKMLCERVRFWKSGEEAELFDKMYENYVYNGFFNECDFNVTQIVDNDVLNWCGIIEEGEKDFEKLLELYKQGEYDVSCKDFEEHSISFIEAVSNDETMILVRY